MEGCQVLRCLTGLGRSLTLQVMLAHERMNPFLARVRGPASREDHIGPLETARPKWEEATQYASYFGAHKTL